MGDRAKKNVPFQQYLLHWGILGQMRQLSLHLPSLHLPSLHLLRLLPHGNHTQNDPGFVYI